MYFVKSHGIGNDFVILEDAGDFEISSLAKLLCDRHFGVGSDGLLIYEDSSLVDFRMRMFNPDGSEAEMCGNGIRCITLYAYKRNPKRNFKVETKAGIIDCEITSTEPFRVRVNMGHPRDIRHHSVSIDDKIFNLTLVSMGNPHAVNFVESVDSVPLKDWGPKIENHPDFPNRTNVEFVQVLDRGHINVRVWERGAGETLACGSGACAVTVASIVNNYTDRYVEITLPGGKLNIEWDGERGIFMEGPAEEVFTGELDRNYIESRLTEVKDD
ncbi:MAG TPA: diaminopimelate epimerase [bacterium]|nr:diaminopimelate epimerase [bacterium]